MPRVIQFDRAAEEAVLAEWFATTSFDEEPAGVPALDPEPDDPDDEL